MPPSFSSAFLIPSPRFMCFFFLLPFCSFFLFSCNELHYLASILEGHLPHPLLLFLHLYPPYAAMTFMRGDLSLPLPIACSQGRRALMAKEPSPCCWLTYGEFPFFELPQAKPGSLPMFSIFLSESSTFYPQTVSSENTSLPL